MTFDVIIVGGGMVGNALALLLAEKTSLSIAVLEASDATEEWSATSYHHRVSAINLASIHLLQAIKCWDDIKQKRVSPFEKITVWDAEPFAEISFDSAEIAEPHLGYIIENELIQSVLQEKINAQLQIHFFSSIKLESLIQHENEMVFTTKDNRTFKAALAIAADGGQSWLRKAAGIDVVQEDYAQVAIVAQVTTEKFHQKIARQVFLPTGPLAFLPLLDAHQSSIVWSLSPDMAAERMALTDEAFCAALETAFTAKLGKVLQVKQRFTFPLQRQYAKAYIKPRLALVGDAAHKVHPLAGLGVNMGFADVVSLVEVIANALQKQRSFASLANLRRYERCRKAENLPLYVGIDAIKRLFASDKAVIQQLRSFGLNTLNQFNTLKAFFTQHAVGR